MATTTIEVSNTEAVAVPGTTARIKVEHVGWHSEGNSPKRPVVTLEVTTEPAKAGK